MDKPGVDRSALVVDDDVFVLSALAEMLTEEGLDVHTASNGFSAARVAANYHPAIILLDLILPERSGGDLLTELRDDPATHDSAIVIVSGNAHLLTDTQRAQADAIVAKPFDVDDLMSIVRRELAQAAARRAEVPPVAATSHLSPPARSRRAAAAHRTRGRR